MKSIFRLFVFVLLLSGWTLAGLSLHVIRTPQQIPITLLTKDRLGITDTWVDSTRWTVDELRKHPLLLERLIRTHQADVLRHVVDPRDGDVEQQLSDVLERAPKDEPARKGSDRLARRAPRWPWEK